MKKIVYISIVLPVLAGVIIICFSTVAEFILPYIANALKNQMFPSNGIGLSGKSLVVCELLPAYKLGLNENETEYYYGNYYADGIYENYGYTTESSKLPTEAVQKENVTEGSTELADATEAQSDDTTEVLEVFNTDGIVSGPTPITYSMTQLSDFETLISECYVIDSSTDVSEDELEAQKLLSMDMGIDTSGDDIKVLIYHTHGSEGFVDSREGVIEDTVIGVGDELARLLEATYGIKVYHDRNIYDNVNGIIDRSNAYNLSGAAIDSILAENPGIEVVIDLHRDGVNDEVKLVRTVDGRETAQIMFLNGVSRLKSSGDIEYLYNPHKEENLSFSLKLFLNGRSLYGDLFRKIYIRGYCFNLDRVARSTLIEVGAQTNTVEEAKNAMIPLARIINQVLSE